MRVYRIEHRELTDVHWAFSFKYNIGPFACEGQRGMDEDLREQMYGPPGPRDWWRNDKRMLFACPCTDSLLRWFTAPLQRELKRLGFVIAVYDVPANDVDVCPRGQQCAFNIMTAKRVKRRQWRGPSTLKQLAA